MTINFRADNVFRIGLDAIHHIETMWDMALTLPDAYHEWNGKLQEFIRLETQATTDPLARLLIRTPADKWAEVIREHAEQENINQYLLDSAGEIRGAIKSNINAVIDGPDTYDHIISQLPLDEVEETFIRAVTTLGDSVTDATAALDVDPQAAADFRQAGRKLITLTNLTPKKFEHREFVTFTELSDLPELTYTKLRYDSPVMHFTEEEQEQHHAAARARDKAKRDDGEYLTELAGGKHPGMALKVARTYEQLHDRGTRAAQISVKVKRELTEGNKNRLAMLEQDSPRLIRW